MGVDLTHQEIEDYLTRAHTAIVTSVGKDGYPHAVPVWFVYLNGALYFRSMSGQQKAVNLLRNPKICLLVEDGEAWVDLRSVVVRGDAQEVREPEEIQRFAAASEEKYRAFRAPTARTPEATRTHYSRPRVFFKVPLEGSRVATWYNRKIRMKS